MNWQEVSRGKLNRCEGRPRLRMHIYTRRQMKCSANKRKARTRRKHMQQALFSQLAILALRCERRRVLRHVMQPPGAAKFTAQYLAPESLGVYVSLRRSYYCVCVQRIGMMRCRCWGGSLSQLSAAEDLPGNLLVCVMRNRRRFIEINTSALSGGAFGATAAEENIFQNYI